MEIEMGQKRAKYGATLASGDRRAVAALRRDLAAGNFLTGRYADAIRREFLREIAAQVSA